jgi:hypothetical protein
VIVLLWLPQAVAAPVPVRFVTHGFLVLRNVNGGLLASGDLLKLSGQDASRVAWHSDGEQKLLVGELIKTASHYVLKPPLGPWLKLFAMLLGRMPPDSHAWIISDEVPAFVRFEGQLFTTGPIWRIETTSPSGPAPPNSKLDSE